MKKWKKIALVVGAVAVVATVIIVSVKMSQRGVVTVQTGKVAKLDALMSTVTASGEIKPLNYVNVGSISAGQITGILVKEGDSVRKGQLLATLDSIQPAADVEAQKATLRSTEADVESFDAAAKSADAAYKTSVADVPRAKAQLDKDRLNWERSQKLYKDQLIPKSQFEADQATFEVSKASADQAVVRVNQAKAQLEQAISQVNTARRRVEQARASLARSNDVLKKMTYQAPLDGIVTNLPVRQGETVVMGIQNSPGSLLMTIADMSVITAEVMVDETDIVNVRLGQPADVTIDAVPNKTFKGHVTEIGNSAIIRSTGQASSSSNTANQEAKDFKVVVTLDEPPKNLRPGLSTTAKVQTASKSQVLAIPIQALTIRQKSELEEKPASSGAALAAGPDARQKEKEGKKEIQGVFVVRNKKAVFVPVETGITGTTDIEITKGLNEGDEIITGSYRVLRTIRNNALVTVDNKAPKKEDEQKS